MADFNSQLDILERELRNTDDPSSGQIKAMVEESGLSFEEIHQWFHRKRFDRIEQFNLALLEAGRTPTGFVPAPDLTFSSSEAAETDSTSSFVDSGVSREPLWTDCSAAGTVQWNLVEDNSVGLCINDDPQSTDNIAQSWLLNDNANKVDEASAARNPRKRARRTEGAFPCLDCNSSFPHLKSWRDHQDRVHFPKAVFICGHMQNGRRCNKVSHRGDHARGHLIKIHGEDRGNTVLLDAQVTRWMVPTRNLYHSVCGFCSKELVSRADSMRHIVKHMEQSPEAFTLPQWTHRCHTGHELQAGVHYDLPEDQDQEDQSHPRDKDGDCGGSGASGSHAQFFGCGGNGFFGFGTSGEPASNGATFHGSGPQFYNQAHDDSSCATPISPPTMPPEFHTTPPSCQRGSTLPTSLSVGELLGSGGFGKVFKVSSTATGRTLAMKVIRQTTHSSNKASYNGAWLREIEILRMVQHRHIVQYLGSFVRDGVGFILMQPAAITNLNQLLLQPATLLPELEWNEDSLPENLTTSMGCVASALAWIHEPRGGSSRSICHLDVKPDNILVTKRGQWVLADFGLSKCNVPLATNTVKLESDNACERVFAMTPRYAAPEVQRMSTALVPGKVTCAADIWSFGCVLAEIHILLTRGVRALKDSRTSQEADLTRYAYSDALDTSSKWLSTTASNGGCLKTLAYLQTLKSMIRKTLKEDPKERPTAYDCWLELPKRYCCSVHHDSAEHHAQQRQVLKTQDALNEKRVIQTQAQIKEHEDCRRDYERFTQRQVKTL